MNCLFCRKVRKCTIIVKTSTMWLTRREKGMKEIRQGLSVKERSNVGEQTKRRGGSSWEERRKEEGQSKKKTQQRRGSKIPSAADPHRAWLISLSPSPLLLHLRPPPRPGRRVGAPPTSSPISIHHSTITSIHQRRATQHLHHAPPAPLQIHLTQLTRQRVGGV